MKAHFAAASCHPRPNGEAGMSLSQAGRGGGLPAVGGGEVAVPPAWSGRHSTFTSGSQQVLGTRNRLECCSFLGPLPQITTVEGLKITEIYSHGSEVQKYGVRVLAGSCPLERL